MTGVAWAVTLTGLNVAGSWLLGQKVTSGWLVMVAMNGAWAVYLTVTGQLALLISPAIFGPLSFRNWLVWRAADRAVQS